MDPISIARIQSETAFEFGSTTRAILSKTRKAKVVRARHAAMWITRELTERSFPDIALYFGQRHHTSVMHGVTSIVKRKRADPDLSDKIDLIMLRLTLLSGT